MSPPSLRSASVVQISHNHVRTKSIIPGIADTGFLPGRIINRKPGITPSGSNFPPEKIIKKTTTPVLNTIFHGYDTIFTNDKKAFKTDTSGKTK
ncbi:hypothetical protein M1V64_24875 [Escherichia coli]|uniref:hypothetical protein n=1 Tax=Escherichia coli TaxID=562 RepID=UPI0017F5BB9B|nr:hypothetical protein [Escherichia coli]EFI6375083.1 hypothetical protein [Escherichia coli]MBS8736384.1 hypothetical protein [Escherichia coli]MBW0846807.1 hypothetical protein [Escherichia coli]MBW0861100.1 hypothetical protein [Escherichia coli]MCO4921695.1 hypothetical protein [Escherichia coli]